MTINYNIALTKAHQKLFKGLIKTALKYAHAGVKKISVDISIVEPNEIAELNKKFRKIDSVTDVLSFPTMNLTAGEKINLKEQKLNINPATKKLHLGDIIICADVAKTQAEEFEHSYERELCYLLVHGLLHLLGHDHETEEQKLIMRGLEEEVLKKYKIRREENEN